MSGLAGLSSAVLLRLSLAIAVAGAAGIWKTDPDAGVATLLLVVHPQDLFSPRDPLKLHTAARSSQKYANGSFRAF